MDWKERIGRLLGLSSEEKQDGGSSVTPEDSGPFLISQEPAQYSPSPTSDDGPTQPRTAPSRSKEELEVLQIIQQAAKDRVTTLNLFDKGITKLPPEIGQLSNLTSLNLRYNQLSSLPTEIGQLTNLTSLDLYRNRLSSLPAEIGQLSNLTTLYLYENQLSSLPAEIGQLSNLITLDLYENQLSSLPAEIGQLSNLSTLSLSNNQLSSLPVEIGQLSNLSTLSLSNNQLSSLPAEIGQLSNLSTLYLHQNQLSSLPAEIGQLTNLTALNLRWNQLSSLLAEIGQLTNLTELYLYNNQLSSLPAEIGQLTNLTSLDLESNRLSSLPAQIGQLTHLITFSLERNQLSSLPAQIGQLTHLTALFLKGNQLSSLPAQIGQLSNLTKLSLYNNQLSSLPAQIGQLSNLTRLDLRDNPLPIPPEILERIDEPATILDYYSRERRKPLNEAKLVLVGEGRVGKTSLVRRLVEKQFDPDERITEGIAIKEWKVTVGEAEIRVNIWDFGGQEIMHATHQFFLTLRTLYVLVFDVQKDEASNRLEYWLKLIESFAADSPIIVVSNQIDQPRNLYLNQGELKKKYAQIKAFVDSSCQSGEGMGKLEARITSLIGSLAHVRDEIPLEWLAVKGGLEGLGKDYVAYDDYVRLCEANHVRNPREQRTLIRLLHDLGVVLHFQDDARLSSTSVLNPEWVTGGVYQIINAKLIKENKGLLKIGQLDHILDSARYPKEKHLFILDMMRKFELCFDLEGHTDEAFLIPDLFEDRVLIPDVLPKEESQLDWPTDSLTFEYHYDFLPRSVISRLMVRMHSFIFQQNYWVNGVVLVYNKNKALVNALPEEKKIIISISGKQSDRRAFWAKIRQQFDDIHKSIKGLNAQAKIQHQGELIDYRFLLNLQQKGIEQYPVDVGDDVFVVNVRELLEGVKPAPKSVEREEIGALKKILESLRLRVHPQKYYSVAFSLGRLYYEEMGDYTLARQALVDGHEAIEALRGMVQEENQLQLSAQSVRLYEMLVRCYLVEGDENKAFEYAAAAKGRAFVNRLAEARVNIKSIVVERPDFAAKLADARQKRQQIDELQKQIDEEGTNRDERLGQQSVLLREEAELWREMARDYPILTATLTVPSLSAKEARTLASEVDATLVEYYRHSGGWCAFVVTPDGIEHVDLPYLDSDLLKELVEWRNDLHLPLARNWFLDQSLESLYQTAIAPFVEHVIPTKEGSKRLVIAPFERLHLLPLAAAGNAKRYLVDEHTLSFVPSLTALYVVNQERKRLPSPNTSFVSTSVGGGKGGARVQSLLSVAYPGPPASRNYLPNVLDEANAIVERLSKVAMIGKLHEEEATPDNVIREASGYDMIHFGCHGRFKSDEPSESGLRLAGAKEDAYLTVQRIIGELNLKPTRLATLAACLTGEVKLHSGEEHVGLLQAMMTAGVQTVIASLWHVDDAATRALFEAFYYREADMHSAPLAMRDASLLLRKTWSHPYYWAAFQVNGLPPFPQGGFALPPNTAPAEWPPDLLEQIEKDKQRSIITRGMTMDDQLIKMNADVLLKTMQRFPSQILPALRRHPLSEELAQQSIVADPLNVDLEIAKALLRIVMDNPTLRQAFPESEVGEIRFDEELDEQSRESRLYQQKIIPLGNKVADVGHYLDLYLQQPDQEDRSLAAASNLSRLSRFVAGFRSFISRKQ